MSVRAMPERPQPRGRTRSNSLQRMLELEKKFLIQRLAAAGPKNTSHPTPDAIDHVVPGRTGTNHSHARRAESLSQPGSRRAMTPSRQTNPAAPPPLVINTSARGLHHPPPVPAKNGLEMENAWKPSADAKTPDRAAHKNVAFMFPPEVEEQRSVCQSPSWEAYGRRKKEKKEEKKEKEQALKDAKPKHRRLSKLPPTSPSVAPLALPAVGDRSVSDSAIPRRNIQPKPRPSSVLGIVGLDRTPAPEPQKRGRSGSLTSAIKASFEIRRSSFDRTRDTGFIGGIKLEKQRQEFTQQVLDDQAKCDSRVHPALRKSFLGHGSFTPLRSPTSRKNSADPHRRTYPPISMQTASARSSSLPSPTSPGTPEYSRLHFFRGRGGRKSSSDGASSDVDSCAIVDDSEDQGEPLPKKSPTPDRVHETGGKGLTRKGGLYIKTSPTIPAVQKHVERAQQEDTHKVEREGPLKPEKLPKTKPSPNTGLLTPEQPRHIAYAQARSRNDSDTKGSAPSPSEPEPESPPPPEPPRRSSKRNSKVFLQKFYPSLHTPQSEVSHSTKDFFGHYSPPNLELKPPVEMTPGVSPSLTPDEPISLPSPPSIPYASTDANTQSPRMSVDSTSSPSRWSFRDAARSAFGRAHSAHPSTNPPSTTGSFTQLPEPVRQLKGHVPAISVSGAASSSNTHSTPMTGQYNKLPIPQPVSGKRPQTSSSDDSSSDELHSSTPMSTPDTSRPESEKEHPANVMKSTRAAHEKMKNIVNTPRKPVPARYSPPSRTNTGDSELDPIEVAARKVMEAFPDANIRRPSIDRSQSDSNLATDMDFLPKLKHRPLHTRDKSKISKMTMAPEPPEDPSDSPPLREVLMARHDTSSAAPWPATYLEAARKAAPATTSRNAKSHHSPSQSVSSAKVAPLSMHSSHTPDVVARSSRHQSSSSVNNIKNDPVAKMFVECCGCKYYHDMPSKVYEAMANPDGVLGPGGEIGSFAGRVSMTVRCPWCRHEMSTKCCAGFAAMVYIKERLH